MKIIIGWILNAVAIFLAASLLPGVYIDGFVTALILSVVLGAINVIIKPVLIILTLPITILTLGLFLFIINALMILLADSVMTGFEVRNFWWALLFSLVLSAFNAILQSLKD